MNGWTERRQRRRANLDSVRKSMAAWRHRGKRRGLNAWMGRVQDRLTALSLLRRSVAALMHRRLRRGFVTWARPFEMPASTLVYAPSPSAAPPHPFEAAATGVTDDSELALALRREEAARHQAEAQVEALAKKLHAAEVSAAEARAVAAGATPSGVTTRSAAAGGDPQRGGVDTERGGRPWPSRRRAAPTSRLHPPLPHLPFAPCSLYPSSRQQHTRPHDDHERIIRDLRLQLAMSRTHAAKLLLNRRDMGEVARAHAARKALAHVDRLPVLAAKQDLSSGLSEV